MQWCSRQRPCGGGGHGPMRASWPRGARGRHGHSPPRQIHRRDRQADRARQTHRVQGDLQDRSPAGPAARPATGRRPPRGSTRGFACVRTRKMDDPELAAPVTRMIVEGRRGLPGHARRPRRGRGATGAKARFALPHHTWQRGADGNTNGPLREHFPKGADFSEVPDGGSRGRRLRSTGDRAGASASGRRTRSTTQRRRACPENSRIDFEAVPAFAPEADETQRRVIRRQRGQGRRRGRCAPGPLGAARPW